MILTTLLSNLNHVYQANYYTCAPVYLCICAIIIDLYTGVNPTSTISFIYGYLFEVAILSHTTQIAVPSITLCLSWGRMIDVEDFTTFVSSHIQQWIFHKSAILSLQLSSRDWNVTHDGSIKYCSLATARVFCDIFLLLAHRHAMICQIWNGLLVTATNDWL